MPEEVINITVEAQPVIVRIDDAPLVVRLPEQGPPGPPGEAGASFSDQAANVVFAGPTSGGVAQPAFRALVVADIPNLAGTYALTSHNHDGTYAAIAHNHDGVYSPVDHNHTGVYEPVNVNIQAHIASTSNPHSVNASQVGLGNVENTALSTWAGSTNLTTLGTIDTGTWNATAIAQAKVASLVASGKTFTANNTLTLAGTDGTTHTFPDTSSSVARIDAAQTFAGVQTFGGSIVCPTINGGIAANDDITIQGTTHATRTTSYVILQPTAGLVGIGTAAPATKLDVFGSAGGELFRIGNASNIYTSFHSGTVGVFEIKNTYGPTFTALSIDNTGNVTVPLNLTVGSVNGTTSGSLRFFSTSNGATTVGIALSNQQLAANTNISIDFRAYNEATYARIIGLYSGTTNVGGLAFTTSNNNERARFLSTGEFGLGTTAPAALFHVRANDTATAALTTLGIFDHDLSSGTAAAGHGGEILGRGKSSTTAGQSMMALDWQWSTATHASRKALSCWHVYDTAKREGIRIEADGSQAMLGFFGVAAVARASAYTQTYSTADKTHANFTSADLATTAATQTTPWGFASQAQADAIATQFNALRVDVADLKQLVNSIIDDLQAYGLAQ